MDFLNSPSLPNESSSSWEASPLARQPFRDTFGPAEYSPVGGHADHSHFGYCPPIQPEVHNPGWHVTTQVPGFGKAEGFDDGLRLHDQIGW